MVEGICALVVEDDAHSLVSISAILREYGIHFKRNTTGASVVQQARTLHPHFILLDLNLPEGDPYLIIQALRADPALADIPVIAIADSAQAELIQQAQKAGFAGFLAKPLPRRQFGGYLQSILSGASGWEVSV